MLPKTKKKKSRVHYFVRVAFFFIIISLIPIIRQALFPDQITRMYKILLHSEMADCDYTVDQIDKRLLLLTFSIDSERLLRTEIYKGDLRELDEPLNQFGPGRYFFAHSVNFDGDGVAYLTRTLVATDIDMEQIQGIEATVCDRLQNQSGHVEYIEHEPIIKCAVPMKTIVCTAHE